MPPRFAAFTLCLLASLLGTRASVAATQRPADSSVSNRVAAPAPLGTLALTYSARVAPIFLLHPARQTLFTMVSDFYSSTISRFTVLPNSSATLSQNLDALPVIGTVRRRAGRRFNTDDASIDDFAICYRLSSRLGFQMIPGDPAPVKLAVTSIANNTGMTLGLTLRLSRR